MMSINPLLNIPRRIPTYVFAHPQDIHLFLFDLTVGFSDALIEKYRIMLPALEQSRAQQLNILNKRFNYIKSRYLLRSTLAGYLGSPWQAIDFTLNVKGKPWLAEHHQSALHFNLSHSGNFLLMGIRQFLPLGVDIERERTIDIHKVAYRFFPLSDQKALARADNPQELFFQLWTQKEAYIKFLGNSLFEDLPTIRLDQLPLSHQVNALSLTTLPKNYHAALATSQPVNQILLFSE